ncbi:MAG: alpha/beta fold hydrolase [Pseudomonadota bacterium]
MTLGRKSNVVGIATDPVGFENCVTQPNVARPTVIFLNAGVLHRVGPHRLHVTLARLLAANGFASLRVDLSGIGDSGAVPDNLTFRASAVADTRAVMDQLGAETGADRFVLFGLCSGADNALATARTDPRVVGLVLIDPPTYATFRSRVRKLAGRLRNVRGIRSAQSTARSFAMTLRHVSAGVAHRLGVHAPGSSSMEPGRQLPPRVQYRALLTHLVERGVDILSIYSGANGDRFNHADQAFEAFPTLRGRLDVAYFPGANHVFTELARRDILMTTVRRWCDEHYC